MMVKVVHHSMQWEVHSFEISIFFVSFASLFKPKWPVVLVLYPDLTNHILKIMDLFLKSDSSKNKLGYDLKRALSFGQKIFS